MAHAKIAKTAAARKEKKIVRPSCEKCGGLKLVVQYVALAASRYEAPPKRGFWWQCQTATCGYEERTS